MLKYLESLINYIQSSIAFVVMLIKSLLQALMYIPSMMSSLMEAVGYMPAVLTLFATIGITFMVINYIIGRK